MMDKLFGVDLSEFQRGISFDRLKAEGVQFAILRGGDGGYWDAQFDTFYAAAQKAGLPVGAYWFSRATTVRRAQEEAQAMISRLKGKNIQLPVYIDCEANSLISIGRRALTDVVLAWEKEIKAAGYIPGVYTTSNWLKNFMYLSELDGVEKWIAQWSTNPPSLECGMWQFGGETNLLRSNKLAGYTVDQNYMFKDYLEDDNNMIRYKTLGDLKANDNAKQYYLPTIEKLLARGAGSKGGSGDATIIDMSEDMVRTLAILDKAGLFDGSNVSVSVEEIARLVKVPTLDEIAGSIAERIQNG